MAQRAEMEIENISGNRESVPSNQNRPDYCRRVIISICVLSVIVLFVLIICILFYSLSSTKKCGIRYDSVTSMFITNGSETPLGFSPWFVSIIAKNITMDFGAKYEKYIHICGGTIISENWVLTAVHCLAALRSFTNDSCVKLCKVIAGSQKSNDSGYSYGTEHRVVKEIPFSEEYDYYSASDIALLKVDPAFKYRAPGVNGERAIGHICLPEQNEAITETEGDITGFGTTNDTAYHMNDTNSSMNDSSPDEVTIEEVFTLPENLHTAHVKIVNVTECLKIPAESVSKSLNISILRNNVKPENTICAGDFKDRKFSCFFDSGGPLTVLRGNRVTQIGITAMQLTGSCVVDPIWYTVYTRVSYFRNWIRSVTKV